MRTVRWLLLLLLPLLLAWAGAASAQIRSSLPYRTIEPARPPISGVLGATAPDKIEVVQFFYYGCPHCFDQQPLLEDWLARKPADVEFRYVPALRSERWLTLTRAYFALERLGEAQRLHRPIYDVINFDGVMLSDEARLVEWVAKNGVDAARFSAAMASPEVAERVEAARRLSTDYDIRATPTLVVAGRYLFSSGEAGSHHEAIRLLDQFIAQARRERK
ncbi:MAG: thiol:disulfide interchange protein DsbA/DsbL [Burkholderiales bacterium]|nr:thiol:disulfide interchange protein DsbA/DsbL [Burkholderiales bacterium]